VERRQDAGDLLLLQQVAPPAAAEYRDAPAGPMEKVAKAVATASAELEAVLPAELKAHSTTIVYVAGGSLALLTLRACTRKFYKSNPFKFGRTGALTADEIGRSIEDYEKFFDQKAGQGIQANQVAGKAKSNTPEFVDKFYRRAGTRRPQQGPQQRLPAHSTLHSCRLRLLACRLPVARSRSAPRLGSLPGREDACARCSRAQSGALVYQPPDLMIRPHQGAWLCCGQALGRASLSVARRRTAPRWLHLHGSRARSAQRLTRAFCRRAA